MKTKEWYIYPLIYRPVWNSETQQIMWEEGDTTLVYLPASIKSSMEAQEFLERSHEREFGCTSCSWNVHEW